MVKDACHILPFHVGKGTVVKNQPDFGQDQLVLRGMVCSKNKLDPKISFYEDGKKIVKPIYIWRNETDEESIFEKGLHLMEKGLGFE